MRIRKFLQTDKFILTPKMFWHIITNMKNPKIYSASKIWHATKWQAMRDIHGYNINATWIDIPCGTPEKPTGAKQLTDAEKCVLWTNCSNETRDCDMLICYAEKDDEQRGALVEIGGALANGHPVYLIGNCPSFMVAGHSDVAFTKHPLFHKIWTSHSPDGVYDHVYGYKKALEHYQEHYASITIRIFRFFQETTTNSIRLLWSKENSISKTY